MKNKRWALLKEYGDAYEISDIGDLRSVDRIDSSGKRRVSKPIKARVTKKYYCGNVCYNGVEKTVRMHRLVAKYFVPNQSKMPLVNHLDGDTLNNAYWNLEWTDHIGNTIHAIRNRLTRKAGGKDKTLTEKQALKIFNSKDTTPNLSKKYSVCWATINQIRNGKKWGWLTGKVYIYKDGNRKYVEVDGKKITYSELAKKIGTTPPTITYRLNQGWSVEKILSISPKKKGIVRVLDYNSKERVYK